MRIRAVAKSLGVLLAAFTLTGLVPLILALARPETNLNAGVRPWAVMLLVGLGVSALLVGLGWRSRPEEMAIREGFAVTTFIWILASLLGGLGLWLAVPGMDYIGAWFEIMSGLTTTGASVLGGDISIEAQDSAALLWRSMVQWIGGLGIVVISLTLLPMIMGKSGYQLYRAEVPGITADRLAPRLADTARMLLRYYAGYTAAVALGLLACGVSVFDAICHAFTAVSTGGFSTYDNSIEGFGSVAAEWVLTVGMLFGGINFGLMLVALRGRPRRLLRNAELRFFLGWMCVALAVLITSLYWGGTYQRADGLHLHDLFRDACFQAVSLATTTGYVTGYDVPGAWSGWPAAAQLMLILLCVVGACTGSTAGGIKIARFVVALKTAKRELRKFLEPARVCAVHVNEQKAGDPLLLQVAAFVIVYLATWAIGTMILALCGNDLTTSWSAVLSCISNIGPALGDTAPHKNFAGIGPVAQVACVFLMMLGRLEFFGALMILWPGTWRY